MTQTHILRTETDLILIVALVFVERIVLVDILDIGISLVRRVVAFRLLVVVGRVALRHGDTLIAIEDAGMSFVQVTASEVVVVVVGRVLVPCRPHAVVDGNMAQEVGVGGVRAFLLVVQTIQTDILKGSRT